MYYTIKVANNKDADQTAQMHTAITGFLMTWLIYQLTWHSWRHHLQLHSPLQWGLCSIECLTPYVYKNKQKSITSENPKNLDTLNIVVIIPVIASKDSDGMANTVDPDQTDLGLHCLLRFVCP